MLLCLGVLLGALKAGQRLDIYVEEGPHVKQLPVRKAEAWLKWLGNLQTRQAPRMRRWKLAERSAVRFECVRAAGATKTRFGS